jgi:hypothetical protein
MPHVVSGLLGEHWLHAGGADRSDDALRRVTSVCDGAAGRVLEASDATRSG